MSDTDEKTKRDPTSEILLEVRQERIRQIMREGWTREHDSEHRPGELAHAAAAYAICDVRPSTAGDLWPFTDNYKPKDERRNLIRAAALLVAAIELFDAQENSSG